MSNAPKVTPVDLAAAIKHTEIVTHQTPSGQTLRWAVLTLHNGFAVTGKPSCAVSPENDDPNEGSRIAVENAKEELWPILGYGLKEQLYQQTQPAQQPSN